MVFSGWTLNLAVQTRAQKLVLAPTKWETPGWFEVSMIGF